jgi:hypothetical protein
MDADPSKADERDGATVLAAATADAVRAHRQRMAELADGLKHLAREAGTGHDRDTVIASLAEVLRAADRCLARLSDELDPSTWRTP